MSISTIWRSLSRWQAWLVCYASGALLALGFAPLHYGWTLFLSLPVFFMVLDASANAKQAALRGFFFGYGYFTAGTWWISNAMLVDAAKFGWMIPFSILGLSALLGLWFGLFGALFHRFKTGRMGHDLVRFTMLWVAVEYLRSIGMFGFPWNLAGYMALGVLPLAQAASLVGTYGVGLVVVLAGLLPLCFTRRARVVAFSVLALLFVAYGWGAMGLFVPTLFTHTNIRVVQPNIPQALKGTHEGQGLSIDVLRNFTRAEHAGFVPDVTVWPETAYPFTLHGDQESFMMPRTGTLITGTVRAEAQGGLRIWNSVAAMDTRGHVLTLYDKHQLVPFGEFMPLRAVLPLEKITPGNIDFSRGDGVHSITLAGVPSFSPLVCYEVIFPWMAADNAQRPAWLVNVTNDGWYGDSPGPYQHFDMARMRAIEQGLPLVRAANSGISAIIDPHGRVVMQLALGTAGAMDAALPMPLPPTGYARYGEILTIGALFFGWMGSLLLIRLGKDK